MKNKQKRIEQLLDALRKEGVLSINELANSLNVTEITIRRYLQELSERNITKYINKGVILNESDDSIKNNDNNYAYNKAVLKNTKEKIRIGIKAAELIEPHDTIILDSGSTTEFLAKYINEDIPLTILTYQLNILNMIANKKNCVPVIAGGTFHRNTLSFISQTGIELINSIRASKVFISASGISDKLGVTCTNLYEVAIKKSAINSSNTKILISDSSKFDQVKIAPFANLEDFDIIITDSNIPKYYINILKNLGITLYTV